MSFKKIAISPESKLNITALNTPRNWEIFNLPKQIKTASIKDSNNEDTGGFDLKKAIKEHPDHLYVKIFAIKKDEVNDNGDAFSEDELNKGASSFVGVPLFTNHQNDDVEKSRGLCVHSWYDKGQGGIFIIGRVDKVAYPKLARAIEEGYVSGTSMGASRGHDLTLMADGSYKRVDELKEEDEIITHKGNIEKVKIICKTQEHKELYDIKWNGNNNLALSWEHPVLILPYEELYLDKSKKKYRKLIDEINETISPVFRESSLLKPGDYVLEYVNNDEKEIEGIDKDLSFILGVYTAEGYISQNSVGFCFGLDEENIEDSNYNKLYKILKSKYPSNKIRIDKQLERNGLYLIIYNAELSSLCKKYIGSGSHNKKLHPNLLVLNKELQKIFISAYLDGDGCIVKQRQTKNGHSSGQGAMQVSSASLSLLKGIRKICLRLGVPATISSHNRIASSSTVVNNDKKYIEHILYITNTISDKLKKYSRKALNNKKAIQSKFDSFFYHSYLAHRIKSVEIINNDEPTYYVQVGEVDDKNSDHSYILNDIATHNCSVDHSLCSVCHNFARTADDYCSHVRERKNRKYTGNMECNFHKNSSPEEKCHLCGSKKGQRKVLRHDDQSIFEHNYGLKFIENSFVVNPACHDCGVKCILHVPELQRKVASLQESINTFVKNSQNPDFVENNIDKIEKVGGIQELESLKNSMSEVENVVKSMLKQKEQVSMDYVSDLVKVMADLQNTVDELTEMGYGGLPSPSGGEIGVQESGPADVFPSPEPQPETVSPTGGGFESTEMSGLGSVTKPKTSSRKIKDFFDKNIKTIIKGSALGQSLSKTTKRSTKMSDITTEIVADSNDPNSKKIVISKVDEDIFVTEMAGDVIIKVSNVNQFPGFLQEMVKNAPDKAGDLILKGDYLEKGADMATENIKTAADKSNQEVITEKQLEKKQEFIGKRTDDTYESITESKEQLGQEGDERNDTTSDSPQTRLGSPEVIYEGQLEAAGDGCVAHYDNALDIITEKQWDDMSKLVSAKISDDYTSVITEKQLKELLNSHTFTGIVETITEDQFNNLSDVTMGIDRWANRDYVLSLMKMASKVVADLISRYNKSPAEILKIADYINDNDKVKSKASYLAILNSLPYKKEERKSLINNVSYFNKLASTKNQISTIDSIIVAMADNAEFGLRAEDVLDSIAQVLRSKVAMEKVNQMVKETMSDNVEEKKIVSKVSAFDRAIKDLDKPEDGKYQIKATLEDIGVPITNKEAFVKEVKKFAQMEIADESVAAAVIRIECGENGELTIDVEDGAENEITPDDIEGEIGGEIGGEVGGEIGIEENSPCGCAADSKENTKLGDAKSEIKKEAQMMGGEMGGQGGMGQAPGAGASMPTAPGAAGPPPVETFTDEGGLGQEGGIDQDLEPSPPGSMCPVCGSSDVDVIGGKGKCNNCTSEMEFKVDVIVNKWMGTTPEAEEGGEGEEAGALDELGGLGEEGGEGFEMPEEGAMPPMAAMVRLSPKALEKLASEKIKLGSVSPATGSQNTLDIGKGNYICLDTGTKYKVAYATDTKTAKSIWGQWEWIPKVANAECASCKRAKHRFVEALSKINMSEEEFNKQDLQEKIKTIVKLKEAKALNNIKTASKEGSIKEDYKLAYGGYGNKFPIEQCREKIARKFGENAVALSGPCEGKQLADCVCDQLKTADIYTSKIAVKLAETWSDCDGDEECITDQVRNGYSLREASSICGSLKIAVAGPEDLLADELQVVDVEPLGGPGEEEIVEPGIGEDIDVDPFAEEGAGTITIELPIEVAEQLEQKLDEAVGGEGIAEEVEAPIEETPIDEAPIGEEGPIEDEIVPEGTEECMESKPMEEGQMVQEQGQEVVEDEMKPMEVGENLGMEENNRGEIGGKTVITVNGEEVGDNGYGFDEANQMKSRIASVNKINLDLSGVIDTITKNAGEKEIVQQKAQDTKEVQPISAGEGGSQMGHENETIPKADTPSVPRDNATMGQEDTELNPQDKPQPNIPSDDALMGNESSDLAGGEATYTGGDKGQGQSEVKEKAASVEDSDFDLEHMRGFGSSKGGVSRLAERILEAGDKKVEPPAPVAEDKDIQPIKDNGTIGKEEKFDAKEPANVKGSGNASEIGGENEALGDRPDSPKDQPSIPADDALMGHEGRDKGPEKQTKDKGTVIADSNSESEAYRVAGRMLEQGFIKSEDLKSKVVELQKYEPAQIKDFEKSIFAGKKGLDSVSDGLSQPVIINETSNQKDSQEDLSSKLASLFSLEIMNKEADQNENTQMRKTYGRF